jgi:hypothetical protein
MNTLHTESEVSAVAFSALRQTLRQQYQPKAIVAMANADMGAKKFIYGCGGGKTRMMAFGVAFQIIDGNAKKIVVTAPSIRLCRQLEEEFIEIFYYLGIKKYINFVNVSSDGKQKATDLDADDLKEEQADKDEEDSEGKKSKNDTDRMVAAMGWNRDTIIEHTKIEAEIVSSNVTIFFVCKPSFLKNFRYRVAKVKDEIDQDFEIDITCHDEFHTFISAEKKQKCKSALQTYGTFSRNNWFFSASRRSVEGFHWTDPLFGELIDSVSSGQLVKWGYLVPELKIYIVTASMLRNISFPVTEKFEAMYKAKASDFLRETKVVLRVTEHQLLKTESNLGRESMKGLLFSKRVAFTKEMKASPEFDARMQAISSGFNLFQMDGSTKQADRDNDFIAIRDLESETPAWLLQHSICRMGINSPNFDCAILARGMGAISMQQALGRIQRMYAGKDCAYLYIYVDDIDYEKSMKDLASFLHYNLEDYDISVEKLVDDTSGTEDEDDDNEDTKVPNLSSVKVKLMDPMVIIKEHQREMVEEEEKTKRLSYLSNLDEDELNEKCPI